MLKGVLDRIEEETAVILLEEIGEEFTVPAEELPETSEEGTYFTVEKCEEGYRIVEIDEEETKEAKDTSEDLLAQLRAKSKGSNYRRK